MSELERLKAAVGASDPVQALRSQVLELAAEGRSKAELYALLEHLLLDVRVANDGASSAEDTVLDVMDALSGWCHPDAELLPGRGS